MKSFENTVARYRKTAEMVDELKDYVNTLSAERDALEAEIVAHCAEHPEAYNVFMRKTSSAGIVGRSMFTVAFSQQLARTMHGERLDDQEWLKSNAALKTGAPYVASKMSLLSGKVNADFKSGKLSERELRMLGLKYERKASVTARRIPNDAELAAIRRDAEALTDEIGS